MAAIITQMNKRKAALVLLALLLTAVLAWSLRSWPGRQAGAPAGQQQRNGALALRAPGNARIEPGAGPAVVQTRSTVAGLMRNFWCLPVRTWETVVCESPRCSAMSFMRTARAGATPPSSASLRVALLPG